MVDNSLCFLSGYDVNLSAPQPTSYDIQFSAFGIPVRISVYFWITAFLLGYQFGQAFSRGDVGTSDPRVVVIAIAVIFLSILIHELGHAMFMRWYGFSPQITLYHFGGLASYDPGFSPHGASYRRAGNSTWARITISIAGPLAGFCFAGLTFLILVGAGYLSGRPPLALELLRPGNEVLGAGTHAIRALVWIILFINIGWGVLNLLPVYPLDGGQIARELFLWFNRVNGLQYSLYASMAFAGLVILFGANFGDSFLVIMFALLAMGNYQQLSGGNSFGGRPW
ncbi:probable Zn-dependent protease [Blastopirellula marina DSM 3645]|uniref:Probable Zn-dependent protease n=1 Tax=Blastopirellula marina DSM 3645 TaxID=314230 RepID=A3ZQV9_9BACT|nr:probable Zn-dependent protease [Blastopirellula marina DSM 3645]